VYEEEVVADKGDFGTAKYGPDNPDADREWGDRVGWGI
jgi:hypothetical protein